MSIGSAVVRALQARRRGPEGAALLLACLVTSLAAAGPGSTDVPSADGTTALHRAIGTNQPVTTIEALVKGGADVNAVNRYGVTPLSLAAANGNDRVIGLLLKSGCKRQSRRRLAR